MNAKEEKKLTDLLRDYFDVSVVIGVTVKDEKLHVLSNIRDIEMFKALLDLASEGPPEHINIFKEGVH